MKIKQLASFSLAILLLAASGVADARQRKPVKPASSAKEKAGASRKEQAAASQTATDKAAAKQAATKQTAPAKAATSKAATSKAATSAPPDKAATSKAPTSKAASGKTAASKAAAAKAEANKAGAKKAAAKKAADEPKSAEAAPAAADELKAKLDAALQLPAAARVEELKRFIESYPNSPLKGRASELLTSARAALGDEKLQAGDAAEGVRLFRLAVEEAPAEIPDKLFVEVISQLPANLFLRGQREAAFELARLIEKRVERDPKRLLALSSFYLGIEQPDEAARLAEAAATLAPEMAAAQLALGSAQRVALRLDRAEAAFRRALELDAQSSAARGNLADLARAAGRSEEALALYRQLFKDNPQDASARTGMVLTLFETGKREEAERELQAALQDAPGNLPLMVGAAWWYLSQGEAGRALELAGQAVRLEPRYTWAQVVLARSLIAQKRPLEAEQALRFARQYGRFPTLDYELANALAAAGLYEEAAEELAHTFTLKDGQLETRLAGRTPARASDFIELLAPERRASISQNSSFDTPSNARMLKGLLALYLSSTDAARGTGEAAASSSSNETLRAALKEFTADDADSMRVFRQLYAASRLSRRAAAATEGAARLEAWQSVLEASEAAMSGLDAALELPVATMAVMAEELRDYRVRANAVGASTAAPDVPRNVLSNIVRGRIEDLAGWSLFNQGKTQEAVVRLRRATSVLPPESPWWRNAHWHLGTALEAAGNQSEALAAYMRSYNLRSPDPARRLVIERLYQRLNGSLEGFEEKLGRGALARSNVAPITNNSAAPSTTDAPTPPGQLSPASASSPATTATPFVNSNTNAATTPTPLVRPDSSRPSPQTSPETPAEPATQPTPLATSPAPASPEATPSNNPAANAQTSNEQATNEQTTSPPQPSPTPARTSPEPASDKTTSTAPTTRTRRTSGTHKVAGGVECQISLSDAEPTITRSTSITITVSLAGLDDASAIKVSTPDWAHIIILAEPRNASDAPNSARYTISSIGKTPGTFTVLFNSPCGSREVKVTVK